MRCPCRTCVAKGVPTGRSPGTGAIALFVPHRLRAECGIRTRRTLESAGVGVLGVPRECHRGANLIWVRGKSLKVNVLARLRVRVKNDSAAGSCALRAGCSYIVDGAGRVLR